MPGGVHQFTNGAVRPQVGLDDRFLGLHRRINHGLIGNQAYIPYHCVKPQQSGDVIEVLSGAAEGLTMLLSLPHGHVAAVLGIARKIGLDRLRAAFRPPRLAALFWR